MGLCASDIRSRHRKHVVGCHGPLGTGKGEGCVDNGFEGNANFLNLHCGNGCTHLCQYTNNHSPTTFSKFQCVLGRRSFYGQVIFHRAWLDHDLAVHQLMGLSPLWGHHDHTCISLWVDAFFCVLDTHLGVVLLRWRREHAILPHVPSVLARKPGGVLWFVPPGYGHALSLCRGSGGPPISSSSRVLLQPCLGTGTAAGAPQLELPERVLPARPSLLPCLSLFLSLYLPLSESLQHPSALWLSPTAGLVVTQEVVQEGSDRPGG